LKNILIINAHQKWEGMSDGKLNDMYQNIITSYLKDRNFNIKTTKIHDGYDINEEVDKHVWADLVITQTPVFWLNLPWIHKKYIDEVFTASWAQEKLLKDDGRSRNDATKQYGTGGITQGKKYMLSTTWNAPKSAFEDPSQFMFEGKSADDALINVTNIYKFSGFQIIEGFHSYDVVKNPQIEKDVVRLNEKLNALIKNYQNETNYI